MGPAKAVALVATVGLAVSLAGCAQPAYKFVASSDRDLVLRVPRSWTAMNMTAVYKAVGVDPATASGWTAFYDASPEPDVKHLDGPPDDPILVVQSFPVTKDQAAAGVTPDSLRQMILPLTAAQQATATAQKSFTLLLNSNVSTRTARGAHLTFFAKDTSGAGQVIDEIALIDPKNTRVRTVRIQCSQSCFTARKAEIDDAVTSLTLKPVH